MKVHEDQYIQGRAHIVLRGPDREIKEERESGNTITVLGDAHVADQMSDQGNAAMGWMAVGTTSGGKTSASATLENELDRNALDSTTQGAGAADNDVIYVASWAAGDGTGALVEAGIFNATPAGVMLCYTEFAVVNKAAGDTLSITWTVTFGAS